VIGFLILKTVFMIIVHETFVCKPGNASKLAKLFKEVMGSQPETMHIMTDFTGQYNRVIIVNQFESLSAFEKSFEQYQHPTEEMKQNMEKMKDYHELYLSGSREIFNVW
jgi:heme-degrading monooxygenase HmoA